MIAGAEKAYEYGTETTIMLPYRPDQAWLYPEDFLATLYFRLVEDDLLDIVFPGMKIEHLNGFMAYFASGAHPIVIGFIRNAANEIVDIAGFGWVIESDGVDGARKASVGFAFFRKYWGKREIRALAWFFLKWWIDEIKIDVLFGVTLADNMFCRNFCKKFGFKEVGNVPYLFYRHETLEDATILLLTKGDFVPRYERWRQLAVEGV